MNPKEFSIKLKELTKEVQNVIDLSLPIIVGKVAVDHFKENFHNEGFTDQTNKPWEEVERRKRNPTGKARDTRKILTGETGDLGESIEYDKSGPGEVTISSDKPYSQAHNEGTTTAGRSRNVTIPQRQFIGDSKQLTTKIIEEINDILGNILK